MFKFMVVTVTPCVFCFPNNHDVCFVVLIEKGQGLWNYRRTKAVTQNSCYLRDSRSLVMRFWCISSWFAICYGLTLDWIAFHSVYDRITVLKPAIIADPGNRFFQIVENARDYRACNGVSTAADHVGLANRGKFRIFNWRNSQFKYCWWQDQYCSIELVCKPLLLSMPEMAKLS